jgi:hypothetical protein
MSRELRFGNGTSIYLGFGETTRGELSQYRTVRLCIGWNWASPPCPASLSTCTPDSRVTTLGMTAPPLPVVPIIASPCQSPPPLVTSPASLPSSPPLLVSSPASLLPLPVSHRHLPCRSPPLLVSSHYRSPIVASPAGLPRHLPLRARPSPYCLPRWLVPWICMTPSPRQLFTSGMKVGLPFPSSGGILYVFPSSGGILSLFPSGGVLSIFLALVGVATGGARWCGGGERMGQLYVHPKNIYLEL